jgi:hypothetical protein
MLLQAIRLMNSSRSSITVKTDDGSKQLNSKGKFRLSFRSREKRNKKFAVDGEDDLKLTSALDTALKIDGKSPAVDKRKSSMRTVLDDFEDEHFEFFHPQRRTTHQEKIFEDHADKKRAVVANDHGETCEEKQSVLNAAGDCESQPKNIPTEGRTRCRMSLTGQHTLEMVKKQSIASRSSSGFKEAF